MGKKSSKIIELSSVVVTQLPSKSSYYAPLKQQKISSEKTNRVCQKVLLMRENLLSNIVGKALYMY